MTHAASSVWSWGVIPCVNTYVKALFMYFKASYFYNVYLTHRKSNELETGVHFLANLTKWPRAKKIGFWPMAHPHMHIRGSKAPWDLSWAPWGKFGTPFIRWVHWVATCATTGAKGFICCKIKPSWFTWCVIFGWTSQVFRELMKTHPVLIVASKGTQQRYSRANRRSGTQNPDFFHAFCLQMPWWRGPNSLGEW